MILNQIKETKDFPARVSALPQLKQIPLKPENARIQRHGRTIFRTTGFPVYPEDAAVLGISPKCIFILPENTFIIRLNA